MSFESQLKETQSHYAQRKRKWEKDFANFLIHLSSQQKEKIQQQILDKANQGFTTIEITLWEKHDYLFFRNPKFYRQENSSDQWIDTFKISSDDLKKIKNHLDLQLFKCKLEVCQKKYEQHRYVPMILLTINIDHQ